MRRFLQKLFPKLGFPIQCDKCGEEVTRPGGLVFSPPFWGYGKVRKYHICYDCWPDLWNHIHK